VAAEDCTEENGCELQYYETNFLDLANCFRDVEAAAINTLAVAIDFKSAFSQC